MNTLERWHEIIKERKPELLDEILAEECVFLSPVVHTPQRGREITKLYLTGAMHLLGHGFRYEKEVVSPAGLRSPALPYSWGIRVGNMLFVSGATSRDPDTYQPVTGDVPTQTRRVFGNVGLGVALGRRSVRARR